MDDVTADLVHELKQATKAWVDHIERGKTHLGPIQIGGLYFPRCDRELLITAGIEAQRMTFERKAEKILDLNTFATARQRIREAAHSEIARLTEHPIRHG